MAFSIGFWFANFQNQNKMKQDSLMECVCVKVIVTLRHGLFRFNYFICVSVSIECLCSRYVSGAAEFRRGAGLHGTGFVDGL